jgi:hypothetical protein
LFRGHQAFRFVRWSILLTFSNLLATFDFHFDSYDFSFLFVASCTLVSSNTWLLLFVAFLLLIDMVGCLQDPNSILMFAPPMYSRQMAACPLIL